jgi:methyltransferase
VVIVQRIVELYVSSVNTRNLRASGAIEHGAGHFPMLVAVHVLYPVALVLEVIFLGSRPGPAWPLWLALWLAAQALRYSAVHALGPRWSVGIWVERGRPLVRTGPYAHMRHPNYCAVVIELLCGPLIFGAWRTALVISILDLIALRVRARAEERAQAEALAR